MTEEQVIMWKKLSTPPPWLPPDGVRFSRNFILKRYLGITDDELPALLAEMGKDVELNDVS